MISQLAAYEIIATDQASTRTQSTIQPTGVICLAYNYSSKSDTTCRGLLGFYRSPTPTPADGSSIGRKQQDIASQGALALQITLQR